MEGDDFDLHEEGNLLDNKPRVLSDSAVQNPSYLGGQGNDR